jgi:hypothetical protein
MCRSLSVLRFRLYMGEGVKRKVLGLPTVVVEGF